MLGIPRKRAEIKFGEDSHFSQRKQRRLRDAAEWVLERLGLTIGPAAGAGAENGQEAGAAELHQAMGEIHHHGGEGGPPGIQRRRRA